MRIIVMCKVAPVSVFVTRKSPIYILAILHGEQYSVFTFPFPVEVSVIVNSVGALHPECPWCLHRPLRPGSESPLQCQQCEISSATWLRRRDTALICADPGPGQRWPPGKQAETVEIQLWTTKYLLSMISTLWNEDLWRIVLWHRKCDI